MPEQNNQPTLPASQQQRLPLPLIILIAVNIIVVTTVGVFVMVSFQRTRLDDEFYQQCVKLKNEYRVDVEAGNVDIFCTKREWWQLNPKFPSPQIQYRQGVENVDELEKKRAGETKELNDRIVLLTQQIKSLELQNYDPQDIQPLNYYTALTTVDNLESQLKQKQIEKDGFIRNIEKVIATYPNPPAEFVNYLGSYKQKNIQQQNLLFPEITAKWEQAQTTWGKELAANKLSTSVSESNFLSFFSTIKPFTAQEFVELSNKKTGADTNISREDVQLFSSLAANQYVQQFASQQGYQFRAVYTGPLTEIQGERLQSDTANAFLAMQQAANADGISLSLTSGYRLVADQAELFKQRFIQNSTVFGGPFSDEQIATGLADAALAETLKTTSIPGKSKHHSGFTVDIGDGSVNSKIVAFADTKAYEWLAQYNFLNAKRFGFVPSYPAGVAQIGPNPEPWEYVWVGEEAVK